MNRDLMAPIAVAKRCANELLPEELQAECLRYAILSGDTSARMNALQQKYDEEHEVEQQEHEAYMRKLEEQKRKAEFMEAAHNLKELEQQALQREPKIHTIVQQIELNVAPKHLIMRAISQIACCALLRAMRTNTSVRLLDLSNNHLTDAIGKSVGKMLEKNKALRPLNLGFNELTPRSLGAIGNALKQNCVLTSLVLESNPILVFNKELCASPANASVSMAPHGSDSGATQHASIEAFTSAIATNSSLTALNVFSTSMNYDVGRALVQAFAKNTSIISLEVGDNSVLQSDLALFASHAKKNQSQMEVAQAKAVAIHADMRGHADELHVEQAKLVKRQEDREWHEANAKQCAEIREQEEWERARVKAEEDVCRLIEIDALDKKYREKLDAEKKAKAGAKAKK
ncbi:hypothetical protein FI667_g11116, partial [Globisporangium splendens]